MIILKLGQKRNTVANTGTVGKLDILGPSTTYMDER
jgi:hypothetical protein